MQKINFILFQESFLKSLKKKLWLLSLIFVNNLNIGIAQNKPYQAYPPNWWTEMHYSNIQILVKNETSQFNKATQVTLDYSHVQINKVIPFENPHYLIIDISIGQLAKPGMLSFKIVNGAETSVLLWELKAKPEGNGTSYAQGVTSKDFIYFLMPDRFSNGNFKNDKLKDYKDQSLNRDSIYDRHGGDLEGITNHLNYFESLGVTALWTTPVLENNMPNRTEHGYAITNHYKVDERFGGDLAYKKLKQELQKRNMKLIMDAVYNHVGRFHFLVQDPPNKDWLHQFPSFTQTNYKDQPYFDPYSSKQDFRKLIDGWFTTEMPDLNHENIFVQNYLIQQTLWCVLEYGIDAWRIDTYIYNNLHFMNKLNAALYLDFPKITNFGECWVHGTANQAYFCENNLDVPFKSNLKGVVDFQLLFYGIQSVVNESYGWTSGVNRLYNTLSNDFLYKDPWLNVIFLDNHDMTRWYSTVNENFNKAKIGLTWLMTYRGIPQLYYGTEVLMKGVSNPDGWVRLDFPGGWDGDKKSAFTATNLTSDESEMLQLTKTLGLYRKKSTALQTGKFMHYIPKDGVYVYFRYDKNQTIMCVINTNDAEKTLNMNDFEEICREFNGGINIVSNEKVNKEFTVKGWTLTVIELAK